MPGFFSCITEKVPLRCSRNQARRYKRRDDYRWKARKSKLGGTGSGEITAGKREKASQAVQEVRDYRQGAKKSKSGGKKKIQNNKKAAHLMMYSLSCGKRDLNPHVVANTRSLVQPVCQFQHSREQMIYYQIKGNLSIGFLKKIKKFSRSKIGVSSPGTTKKLHIL